MTVTIELSDLDCRWLMLALGYAAGGMERDGENREERVAAAANLLRISSVVAAAARKAGNRE